MSETVVCRIDANKKEVIVFEKDDEGETIQTRYRAVLLKDVEWGAGVVRGQLVETYNYPPSTEMTKRAYFNFNHVPRYIDKYTREILTVTPAALLVGSSALYV